MRKTHDPIAGKSKKVIPNILAESNMNPGFFSGIWDNLTFGIKMFLTANLSTSLTCPRQSSYSL